MPTPVREEVLIPTLTEPISHYTHAVSYGDLVFVSGLIATDAEGALTPNQDVEQQTEQVLRDMEELLAAAGTSLPHVLKVTVFLTDMQDRERINVVRQRFFGSVRPASTLVEVSRLAVDGAKVEIEAVACRPRERSADGASADGAVLIRG